MIKINEYEKLTMNCTARGRPTPHIAWFRRINKTGQNSILLANDTVGGFHLDYVNRSHSGDYECQVSNGVNGHAVSKQFEIRVLCKFSCFFFR